jgi:hypothetical protein
MWGIFRKELHTEVVIRSTTEVVWGVLTDFASYAEWNPFISGIRGTLAPGERLTVHFAGDGSKNVTFRPTVLYIETFREVCWMGRLVFPLLFDGKHHFIMETLDTNRVRFIQREVFTGLLVPMLRRELETRTKRGFERMNNALKEHVERIER